MSIYDEGLLPDTQPVSRSRPGAAIDQTGKKSLNVEVQRTPKAVRWNAWLGRDLDIGMLDFDCDDIVVLCSC